MSELRQQDLRFTAAEASQLLSAALVPAMRPAIVNLLNDRAEGWAAGFADGGALVAGPTRIRSASSTRFGQPSSYPRLSPRRSLTASRPTCNTSWRTSILDRLCAPLCDALLDEEASPGVMQAVLERLEQDNLFVVPLDDERFAGTAITTCSMTCCASVSPPVLPATIPVLHQRACDWFCRPATCTAVEHALLAANFERAA